MIVMIVFSYWFYHLKERPLFSALILILRFYNQVKNSLLKCIYKFVSLQVICLRWTTLLVGLSCSMFGIWSHGATSSQTAVKGYGKHADTFDANDNELAVVKWSWGGRKWTCTWQDLQVRWNCWRMTSRVNMMSKLSSFNTAKSLLLYV